MSRLLDALRKAQDLRERQRDTQGAQAQPATSPPQARVAQDRAAAEAARLRTEADTLAERELEQRTRERLVRTEAERTARAGLRRPPNPTWAVGLAAAIFTVTWLAWREQPWRPPAKPRLDPAGLRLDRALDVSRIPSANH